MIFQELSGEQTRRLVDSEQRYDTYRRALQKLHQSYRGSMTFKRVKEQDYLYHIIDGVAKSLGPRSAQTESLVSAFQEGRERQRQRRDTLRKAIDTEARVDRAMGLGRAPSVVADILRKLDRAGLLGRGISVVGTNAIYAYERLAGGSFPASLLATGDIDLLFDGRRRLRMLIRDDQAEGLTGVLRRVDDSFSLVAPGAYRATNDQGFMVDLIQPQQAALASLRTAIGNADDLQAAEVEGLAWLQNVPQIEQTLLDERAQPFTMIVPDPRAFALHKLWLSERVDRDVVKARRDREQAILVARIVTDYLPGRGFDDPAIAAVPAALRARAAELTTYS